MFVEFLISQKQKIISLFDSKLTHYIGSFLAFVLISVSPIPIYQLVKCPLPTYFS